MLEFPSLTSTGGPFNIQGLGQLTVLDCPMLTYIYDGTHGDGAINLVYDSNLKVLNLPKLVTIEPIATVHLQLYSNDGMKEINMGSYTGFGRFRIHNIQSLTIFNLTSVKEMYSNVSIPTQLALGFVVTLLMYHM